MKQVVTSNPISQETLDNPQGIIKTLKEKINKNYEIIEYKNTPYDIYNIPKINVINDDIEFVRIYCHREHKIFIGSLKDAINGYGSYNPTRKINDNYHGMISNYNFDLLKDISEKKENLKFYINPDVTLSRSKFKDKTEDYKWSRTIKKDKADFIITNIEKENDEILDLVYNQTSPFQKLIKLNDIVNEISANYSGIPKRHTANKDYTFKDLKLAQNFIIDNYDLCLKNRRNVNAQCFQILDKLLIDLRLTQSYLLKVEYHSSPEAKIELYERAFTDFMEYDIPYSDDKLKDTSILINNIYPHAKVDLSDNECFDYVINISNDDKYENLIRTISNITASNKFLKFINQIESFKRNGIEHFCISSKNFTHLYYQFVIDLNQGNINEKNNYIDNIKVSLPYTAPKTSIELNQPFYKRLGIQKDTRLEEFLENLNENKIVDISDINNIIHSGPKMTNNNYKFLYGLLKSKDKNNISMAMASICEYDYNKSIIYIIKLIDEFSADMKGTRTWNLVNWKTLLVFIKENFGFDYKRNDFILSVSSGLNVFIRHISNNDDFSKFILKEEYLELLSNLFYTTGYEFSGSRSQDLNDLLPHNILESSEIDFKAMCTLKKEYSNFNNFKIDKIEVYYDPELKKLSIKEVE